jgi:putative ABC transport system permease protein
VRINGQPYRVIGVLISQGGSGFNNLDDQILVPLTTAQTKLVGARRFGGSTSLDTITVQVSDADLVTPAKEEISAALHSRRVVEGEDFIIQSQDILGALSAVTL